MICSEGGGTLPRHNRSNVNRNRPVAKVVATNVISQSPLIMNAAEYAVIDKAQFKQLPATKCFGNHCAPAGVPGGSPMMSKKHPPEPPRRQCSAPNGLIIDPALTVHFEALSLAQQQQQVAAAAPTHYVTQQYPQYFNSHLPHNYQHYSNQPVYANFMGGQHQTTTVEVHAEKIIDSKVSVPLKLFALIRVHNAIDKVFKA